jgi:hypothetical protein
MRIFACLLALAAATAAPSGSRAQGPTPPNTCESFVEASQKAERDLVKACAAKTKKPPAPTIGLTPAPTIRLTETECPALTAQSGCPLTDSLRRAFLKMDFNDFDQSGCGWQQLRNIKDCSLPVARLIDTYIQRKGSTLPHSDVAYLYLHAAQGYEYARRNTLAMRRLQKAFDPTLDCQNHWNAYIRGTIVFLNHRDETGLIAATRSMEGTNSLWRVVLEGYLKCWNDSYTDAGQPSCQVCPPVPVDSLINSVAEPEHNSTPAAR